MVKEINIGVDISNIIKISNIIIDILDIKSDVYIMPMRLKLNSHAYTVDQNNKKIIFVNPNILKKNKASSSNIKLMIHELTHVMQIERGDLVINSDHTQILWMGKDYTKYRDYKDIPYEMEAINNEDKYLKTVYNKMK